MTQDKITDKDYDSRTLLYNNQYYIDHYLEPKKDLDRLHKRKVVINLLKPSEKDKILDIGCGVGSFSYICAKKGANVIGVDYSAESIDTAKKLLKKLKNSSFGKVEFVRGDARSLPCKTNSFNKIVNVDFIEHIYHKDKDRVIKELYRVLEPNGIIVTYTPNLIRVYIDYLIIKIIHLLKFKNYGWQKVKSNEDHKDTILHVGLTSLFRLKKLFIKNGFKITKIEIIDYNIPLLSKIIKNISIFPSIFSSNLLFVAKK